MKNEDFLFHNTHEIDDFMKKVIYDIKVSIYKKVAEA